MASTRVSPSTERRSLRAAAHPIDTWSSCIAEEGIESTAAGVVSELKRLAVPASVDSIPSSAMQEDHVSMGWHAGRKLRRALDGLTRVLAVEVLTAARAIDLRAPLEPAAATGAVRDAVRAAGAGGPGPDRHLAPEIEAVVRLIDDGTLLTATALKLA